MMDDGCTSTGCKIWGTLYDIVKKNGMGLYKMDFREDRISSLV